MSLRLEIRSHEMIWDQAMSDWIGGNLTIVFIGEEDFGCECSMKGDPLCNLTSILLNSKDHLENVTLNGELNLDKGQLD